MSRLFIIILLLSIQFKAFSTNLMNLGLPFIKHFEEYTLGAAKQNWGIQQAANGFMYFANNRGLLEYDGQSWKLYNILNGTIIRALMIDTSGRIFVGASNEFGYFEADDIGNLKYICLSNAFEIEDCGVIWNIIEYDGAIYFISYNNLLLKYKDGEIKAIELPQTFRRFNGYIVHNQFLLFDINAGLSVLKNDTIYRYHQETFNVNTSILSILPWSENEIILGSRFTGLYLFDLNKHSPLNYEQSYSINTQKVTFETFKDRKNNFYYQSLKLPVNHEISDKEIYHGMMLSDSNLVYSTLRSGIYIIDRSGNLVDNFMYNRGLSDNSTFYTFEDSEYNLWVATEKGISLVGMNDGFRMYNSQLGVDGSILSAITIDNKLFIGTTAGLYFINNMSSSTQDNSLPKLITKDDIYINYLYEYKDINGNGLIFNTLHGAYLYDIKKNKITKFFEEYSNYAVMQYPLDNSIFLYSHSGGITILRKKHPYNWDLEKIGTILEDYSDIRRLEFDKEGNLYATTLYSGLLYVKFPNRNDLTNVNYIAFDVKNGLPENDRNRWMIIEEDTILVGTRQGIYIVTDKLSLNNPDLQFVPYDTINNQLDDYGSHITSILSYQGNIFLGTIQGLLAFDKKTQLITRNPFYRIRNEIIDDLAQDDRGRLWILTTDALIYHDEKIIKEVTKKPQLSYLQLKIGKNFIKIDDRQYVQAGRFPFSNNSLQVKAVYPSYANAGNNLFSFFMEGLDETWSNWSPDNKYSISYLPAGNYTLWTKAMNGVGQESNIIRLNISIAAPWFLSWYAWLLYILVVSTIVYTIIKLYTKKLFHDKSKLEAVIRSAIETVEQQKDEILQQRDAILQQNVEITDSIEYARQIQKAILQTNSYMFELFPYSFVLNMPKDIVSGDFFWCYSNDDYKIVAVADCTGHGVPGAFMSIIGVNFLQEIVITKDNYMPDVILNELRDHVITSLHQTNDIRTNKDGMDIAIITLDIKNRKIYYAGANNAIYVVKNNEIIKYPADRMPVGVYYTIKPFTLTTISAKESCNIYMLSDGYLDQFGKITGRKMTSKRFVNVLLSIQHLDMLQQKEFLKAYLENWRRDLIQTDDILVVGIDTSSEISS